MLEFLRKNENRENRLYFSPKDGVERDPISIEHENRDPETNKLGVRIHHRSAALFRNLFSRIGLCSGTHRLVLGGETYYVNAGSLKRWTGYSGYSRISSQIEQIYQSRQAKAAIDTFARDMGISIPNVYDPAKVLVRFENNHVSLCFLDLGGYKAAGILTTQVDYLDDAHPGFIRLSNSHFIRGEIFLQGDGGKLLPLLQGKNLKGQNLSLDHVDPIKLKRLQLDGVNILACRNQDFSGFHLKDVHFIDSTSKRRSEILAVNFSQAILDNVQFHRWPDLFQCDFRGAKLNNVLPGKFHSSCTFDENTEIHLSQEHNTPYILELFKSIEQISLNSLKIKIVEEMISAGYDRIYTSSKIYRHLMNPCYFDSEIIRSFVIIKFNLEKDLNLSTKEISFIVNYINHASGPEQNLYLNYIGRVKLKLDLSEIRNDRYLDLRFNHLNNGRSILTDINKIQDRNIKIHIMEQALAFLTKLSRTHLNPLIPSLSDVLIDHDYQDSHTVQQFIYKKIVAKKIKDALTTFVSFTRPEAHLLMGRIECAPEYSNLINLLIQFGEESSGEPFREELVQLERKFHSLGSVRSYIAYANKHQLWTDETTIREDMAESERLGISSQMSIQMLNQLPQWKSRIYVTEDGQRALIIRRDMKWEEAIFLKRNEDRIENENVDTRDREALEKFLCPFPPFLQRFLSQTGLGMIHGLIAQLNLGEEYENHFQKALDKISYPIKFIDKESEKKWRALFSPFHTKGSIDYNVSTLSMDTTVTNSHLQDIYKVYAIERKDPPVKAGYLLVTGLIFTRYSSSYIFGTENLSPEPLRQYAIALFNAAKELDPSLDRTFIEEMIRRLAGTREEFSCTAVASNKMGEFCLQSPLLTPIYRTLYPYSWQKS